MGNLGNLGCKCGARVRATRVKTAIIWLSQRTHPTMHSICRYYTENFTFLQEFSTRALQLQTSYKTHENCAKMWFSWTPPWTALIHRGDDYVGQIMQENDSRAAHYAWHYAIHTHHFALCYTHTLLCIMQLGNSGLWCQHCQVVWREERDLHIRPILNPGACIGSIYPYWQLCAKNYMAWSMVIPSDQFKSNCCHLMCMAIRA